LNIFNAEKSANGYVKQSIALSFLAESYFNWQLNVKGLSCQMLNFKLKFQTVAEKTAKNFWVLLFCPIL